MDNQTYMRLIEVSPEDRKKSYAKYVDRQIVPAPEHVLKAIEKPMDPEKAILAHNIDDMLKPGYLEVENGWCNLDNGGAYVCINSKFPGCTVDMWNWFGAWRPAEDQNLRYKVWYPPVHYMSYCDNATNHEWMAEALYPGGEVFIATGSGFPFHMLGFSKEALENTDSTTGGFVTLYVHTENQTMADPPMLMTICHFTRPTEDGFEVRSRFWIGYGVDAAKGGLVKTPWDGHDPDMPRQLANHCAEEMTNLATILRQLYEEESGK